MSDEKMALTITNSKDSELLLRLEPWGDEHSVASGVTCRIDAQGPRDGVLEIEVGESVLTVFGWTGCTVEIYKVPAPK